MAKNTREDHKKIAETSAGQAMSIARVFPRRTKATPDDALAFTAPPSKEFLNALESRRQQLDEIHISVAFSYDMAKANQLAEAWQRVSVPVKMGGPAFNVPGGDFIPGRYLKTGYVITSRGCPNRCPFCAVPAREGYTLRELPVEDGFNVLDDNLLACSENHIKKVFAMLGRQPQKPLLTGGLESALLRAWHVDLLREVKAARMYFAYDQKSDYEPLAAAGKLLRDGGITKASHRAAAYVLIGYAGDTMEEAEKRLRATWDAGFVPYAMLFRGDSGKVDPLWAKFQRSWLLPALVMRQLKEAA
jgi:hypothetical protein